MATLAVAGLYNLETNLRIDGFPLPYFPVCFPFNQITQVHSGVGLNVSVALHRLGHTVRYATLVGADEPGQHMREAMRRAGLDDGFVETRLSATPQSVILVHGLHQLEIIGLKDIEITTRLGEIRQIPFHVIAQVIKAQFVIGAIGDIAGVGVAALFV